jgi:prepilin-type N-terminal cleavage/methylation domain-containing protein
MICKNHSQKGVTVIELLIVLGLLSVVFVIAYNIFGLGGLQRVKLAIENYQINEMNTIVHKNLDDEFTFVYYAHIDAVRSAVETNEITEDPDYFIEVAANDSGDIKAGDIVIWINSGNPDNWVLYRHFPAEFGRFQLAFRFIDPAELDPVGKRNTDMKLVYNALEYTIYFFKDKNVSPDVADADFTYRSATMFVNEIGEWGVFVEADGSITNNGTTLHYRKWDSGPPAFAPDLDFSSCNCNC